MKIAIIPARGGSKRIPRKNIKSFAGKPMICYAIDIAKRCGLFDRIVVSTDDDEIAKISIENGAQVPFRRPAELADDYATTVAVIRHAILACEGLGWNIGIVCCIYPGVPLIRTQDLHAALVALENSNAKYSFPVAEYSTSVHRALQRQAGGKMSSLFPEFELSRSQDMPSAYYDAGQFYWGAKDVWLTSDKIHSDGFGVVIPNWRAIDIDKIEDWKRAEMVYSYLASEETDV